MKQNCIVTLTRRAGDDRARCSPEAPPLGEVVFLKNVNGARRTPPGDDSHREGQRQPTRAHPAEAAKSRLTISIADGRFYWEIGGVIH